jgi:putative Holliday junction resolvase
MRVMGLDIGAKRIGIAISDPKKVTARPLTLLKRGEKGEEIEEIIRFIKEYEVEKIVIGLPVSLNGKLGPQAKLIVDYANELKSRIDLPIKLWDERLTTAFAEKSLIMAKVKRSKRERMTDQVAAALILQNYLDAKRMEGAHSA